LTQYKVPDLSTAGPSTPSVELLTAIITEDLNNSVDGLSGVQPIIELTARIIGNKSLIKAMAILNSSGYEIPRKGTALNKFN
jgi:hypothetical protein